MNIKPYSDSFNGYSYKNLHFCAEDTLCGKPRPKYLSIFTNEEIIRFNVCEECLSIYKLIINL